MSGDQEQPVDLNEVANTGSSGVPEDEEISSYFQESSKFARWVIKNTGNLIKNERQVNYILLIFIISALIVTLFLVFDLAAKSPRQEEYQPNTKYEGRNLPDDFR